MSPTSLQKLRGVDPQQSRVQDNVDQVLEPVARALAKTPIMGGPLPSWSTCQLISGNGWTLIPPNAPPEYHVDALGYVHMRGSLYTPAGTASGTVLFRMPVGLRPGKGIRFATAVGTATHLYLAAGPIIAGPHGEFIVGGASAATDSLDFSAVYYLAES